MGRRCESEGRQLEKGSLVSRSGYGGGPEAFRCDALKGKCEKHIPRSTGIGSAGGNSVPVRTFFSY